VSEEAFVRTWLEIEQFLDGAGFGIRTREQIPGGEFVLSKILFDAKGLDLHGKESGKACGRESSAKLTGGGSSAG
jgi:hypothetical protein